MQKFNVIYTFDPLHSQIPELVAAIIEDVLIVKFKKYIKNINCHQYTIMFLSSSMEDATKEIDELNVRFHEILNEDFYDLKFSNSKILTV